MSDRKKIPCKVLDFKDHYLNDSRFERVNLGGAVIRDSQAEDLTFDDVNLSRLKVENVNLSGARFHDVNLSGAQIGHANLAGLQIRDANITGMTIDGILVTDLLEKWDSA